MRRLLLDNIGIGRLNGCLSFKPDAYGGNSHSSKNGELLNWKSLVELKGAGEIKKAFSQLSYTRDNRQEYQNIITKFKEIDAKKLDERFIIVSNGMLSKPEKERLEKEYRIRVQKILYSEVWCFPMKIPL